MIISLIVAVDENNGIGIEGRLPWKVSSDLRRFKSLTMGHHIIMGRKTWQSIGRALKGRTNVIISQNLTQPPENTVLKRSLIEALNYAEKQGETEVFVIGGGLIFAQALALANRIYLSKIHATISADTFFPDLNWDEWLITENEEIPASEFDQYAHSYMILERRNGQQSIV